jgi:hypothetical protein
MSVFFCYVFCFSSFGFKACRAFFLTVTFSAADGPPTPLTLLPGPRHMILQLIFQRSLVLPTATTRQSSGQPAPNLESDLSLSLSLAQGIASSTELHITFLAHQSVLTGKMRRSVPV